MRTAWVLALSLCSCALAVPGEVQAPPSRPRLYVVAPGDSLSAIAARYAVAGGADRIARLNGVADPERIHPGRELTLPAHPPLTDALAFAPPPLAVAGPPGEPCGRRVGALQWPRDQWRGEACVELSPSERVCQRLMPSAEPGGTMFRLSHERAGSRRLLLEGEASWPWLGRVRVLAGPLQDDGTEALVVTRLDAVSNGLNYRSFDVAVVPRHGPLVQFRALDIDGFEPAVELRSEAGRCALRVREEERQGARDRGYGNYFVTRAYRVGPAGLVPQWALQRARIAPDGSTQALDSEWLDRVGAVSRERVHIANVDGTVLRLVHHDGRARDVLYFRSAPLPLSDTPPRVSRLGDAGSGRLFPRGYRVDEADWLARADATLALYERTDGTAERVLWLEVPTNGAGHAPR